MLEIEELIQDALAPMPPLLVTQKTERGLELDCHQDPERLFQATVEQLLASLLVEVETRSPS